MPNSSQPSQPSQPSHPDADQVQADNLLSQPDPDTGAVAEEVSLDQQSDGARRVGQLPKDAEAALAESLKKDSSS